MTAWSPGELRTHFGVFACGLVVQHPVQIQVPTHGGIDGSQEAEEFLMAVTVHYVRQTQHQCPAPQLPPKNSGIFHRDTSLRLVAVAPLPLLTRPGLAAKSIQNAFDAIAGQDTSGSSH